MQRDTIAETELKLLCEFAIARLSTPPLGALGVWSRLAACSSISCACPMPSWDSNIPLHRDYLPLRVSSLPYLPRFVSDADRIHDGIPRTQVTVSAECELWRSQSLERLRRVGR